ncbi:hypothetical protein BJ875DRAFT_249250 [Amylocarpus encephaloides]|uniref:Uncharacterized protein n=1 Tax=Amylocarpus encephaloides TaxID=45428 RepID=A0A9P7YLZ7_9HELO|nr:hypothetical protein BJ875DRAFT_249250 [Amylocarpus encephaloides]
MQAMFRVLTGSGVSRRENRPSRWSHTIERAPSPSVDMFPQAVASHNNKCKCLRSILAIQVRCLQVVVETIEFPFEIFRDPFYLARFFVILDLRTSLARFERVPTYLRISRAFFPITSTFYISFDHLTSGNISSSISTSSTCGRPVAQNYILIANVGPATRPRAPNSRPGKTCLLLVFRSKILREPFIWIVFGHFGIWSSRKILHFYRSFLVRSNTTARHVVLPVSWLPG